MQCHLAFLILKFTGLSIQVKPTKTLYDNIIFRKFSVSDNVRDTWITVEGKLVTSRYEAEFDHGDFCIDREVETGGVVAVMCDACKKGVSSFTFLRVIVTTLIPFRSPASTCAAPMALHLLTTLTMTMKAMTIPFRLKFVRRKKMVWSII
jgi:hypothetical protein